MGGLSHTRYFEVVYPVGTENGKLIPRQEGYIFRRTGWKLLSMLIDQEILHVGGKTFLYRTPKTTLDQFGS